jgi:hypothetical protein
MSKELKRLKDMRPRRKRIRTKPDCKIIVCTDYKRLRKEDDRVHAGILVAVGEYIRL